MKKIYRYILIMAGLLVCLLGLSVLGASAASGTDVQDLSATNLATAFDRYKQSHSSAARHTITASHKVVYAKEAYFKDVVNASDSWYYSFAKTGSDSIVARLAARDLSVSAISDANASASFEIQVGLLDRAEQQSYLTLFDVNEYAIVVTSNRIMLLAWQDAALQKCVESFLAYLRNGSTVFPVGFVGVGEASGMLETDFVRPTGAGISLSAGQYVNDDSLQFLYTGSGVTRGAYLTYCEQLLADGFSLVWENTIESNEFRMYKNTAKSIALYVAYHDYTYNSEFEALYEQNYGTSDDVFAPHFEKCIRIISAPLSSLSMPTQLNSPQPYTKVTDTYMTTVGIAAAYVGTCHVIMLEDGRFVIIDGGRKSNDTVSALWDTMVNLYKKAYGSTAVPTAQRPIHVAAWYLTHAHDDHYTAFAQLANVINGDSAKKTAFRIDYVIANLPGRNSIVQNSVAQWGYNNSANIHNLKSKIGDFQYVKVHAGQRIYLANLMIEVLMTYEDLLPNMILNSNDTCTVTRFHVKSSGAAVNSRVTSLPQNAVTVMFLGDSWRPSSRFLCAMYGDYLRSDITQVAHHGNIGCEQELYAKIAPTGVLFNNDKSSFVKYVWGKTGSTNPEVQNAYAVDHYVVAGAKMNGHVLQSVRYVWAAVDGMFATLQFTTFGAMYEDVFDLETGESISYVDLMRPSAEQTGFAKHVHGNAGWKRNDTHHWKECSCGLIMEYGEHTQDEGNVIKEPTEMQTGIRKTRCTACSKTEEISIPCLDLAPEPSGKFDFFKTAKGMSVVAIACGALLLIIILICHSARKKRKRKRKQ